MTDEGFGTITGFEGAELPSRFTPAGKANRRLAVVLPGYAYSIDAPLFRRSAPLITEQGFDLLEVDYRYNEHDGYQRASSEGRSARFAADMKGLFRSLTDHPGYTELLFVGKSMGTMGMARLLQSELPWDRSAAVWLTPATGEGELLRLLERTRIPSLVVIGTADQFYRSSEIEAIAGLPSAEALLIEGGDHGLEVAGDSARSQEILEEVLQAITAFLTAGPFTRGGAEGGRG